MCRGWRPSSSPAFSGCSAAAPSSYSNEAAGQLKPGDFIPKINDTFVHSVGDLTLVDAAYEKDEQVFIQFTRWYPDSSEFKTLISRRRFVR